MIEPHVMDWLVRNATLSADSAVIGPDAEEWRTLSDMTKVAVRRAIEALEANGLITITPVEDWPPFYALDPPYTGLAGERVHGEVP